MLRFMCVMGALLVAFCAASAESTNASLQRDSARCQAGSVDACYDAIRWNPRDPALLVGLGDGLARAGRPADAIRNYRRAAAMSPNFPGLSAKINAAEGKMTVKRAPKPAATTVASNKPAAKYSNAAPESESH
jgi:hypothetical protein